MVVISSTYKGYTDRYTVRRWTKHRDLEVLPASAFTLEALTEAYNETRADYIIPMPMSVNRLKDYIHIYDVDLSASCVIRDAASGQLAGLGMLGIRGDQGWITRLGVLPNARKRGMGRKIMQALISNAYRRRLRAVWLEVIKGNDPAHNLFHQFYFRETRELLVARRPPSAVIPLPDQQDRVQVQFLDADDALAYLRTRSVRPNWLNGYDSYHHISDMLKGLKVTIPGRGVGWVVYESNFYQMRRIVVHVVEGDQADMTAQILNVLHQHSVTQDAQYENLPADDPRWPGYQAAGYFDAFRRIEMVKRL